MDVDMARKNMKLFRMSRIMPKRGDGERERESDVFSTPPSTKDRMKYIQSSRSGNESFLTYFRFLPSHTTVHVVRHTAV